MDKFSTVFAVSAAFLALGLVAMDFLAYFCRCFFLISSCPSLNSGSGSSESLAPREAAASFLLGLEADRDLDLVSLSTELDTRAPILALENCIMEGISVSIRSSRSSGWKIMSMGYSESVSSDPTLVDFPHCSWKGLGPRGDRGGNL